MDEDGGRKGTVVAKECEASFDEAAVADFEVSRGDGIGVLGEGASVDMDPPFPGFDGFSGKSDDALDDELVAEPGDDDIATRRRGRVEGPGADQQHGALGQGRFHAVSLDEHQTELCPGQNKEEEQSGDGPAEQNPSTAWRGFFGNGTGCVHRVSAWG